MSESVDKEACMILLALGNPSEAMALERHLTEKYPHQMEIYRAPSGFDAMSLAMNRPRAVLLDQRLPDVMGLDMIDPIRDQIGPENFLVFIGGSGKGGMRPGMRDEALKRGATAICERPLDNEWLGNMIYQLLFPVAPEHPHMHGLELLDLIQLFHQKRCDRTLRIFANDGRVGSIFVRRGEITHVEAGGMQGFAAILDLMRWTEGRIVVFDGLLSSEKTNEIPTMHLIMDAARIMDEEPSQPSPQNALEAMPDLDIDGTPMPIDDDAIPTVAAPHSQPPRKAADESFRLPSLDLDADFD